MSRWKRGVLIWSILAILAVSGLTAALIKQNRRARERWPVFLTGSPEAGLAVFRDKGCSFCHAVNGMGGKVGPDLGRKAKVTVPQMITAMWNHGPQMFDRMKSEGVTSPTLSYAEVAQLLSYIYLARFVDAAGNSARGRALFSEDFCDRCHTIGKGARVGPDLAHSPAVTSSSGWVEALWNHASAMEDRMRADGIVFPYFNDDDVRDLLAYVRSSSGLPVVEPVEAGDPERGWIAFQRNGCTACHSIRDNDGSEIPNLGPSHTLPATFVQFGGAMLNHSPAMRRMMVERGIARPQFQRNELADITAFLYTLRYVEPGGSPMVGRSVFRWRGCSRCHGPEGEGLAEAPALRGRGQVYTTITLATAFWRHGDRMYRRSQELKIGWPTLNESDIGDLLAFLNSQVESTTALR